MSLISYFNNIKQQNGYSLIALIDPDNNNFKPIENSVLVDSGSIYDDLDINYSGQSPDIGAYEFGGDDWVPGITWDLEQEFGLEFVFPDSPIYILGDLNQDNFLDILDIVLLVNYIIENLELSQDQINIADFNQDSFIDILDVVSLINFVVSN